MHIVEKKSAYFYVFILLVVMTKFFDFVLFSHRFFTYGCLIGLSLFFIRAKQSKENYKNLIGMISALVILSCVFSYVKHHQALPSVIASSYFALGLLFFFIPLFYNLSFNNSVKLVRNFSILFCFCYVIQWLLFPIILFSGALDEFSIIEENFRMRMTCSLCSYCLFFYGINHLFIKKKLVYILYILLGFIPVIIMGFRSLIALTVFFVAYLMISLTKSSVKKLLVNSFFAVLLSFIVLQVPLVQNKIEEMAERQDSNQTFDNEDYIRYVSLSYYFTEIYTDTTERIIGGGFPMVSKKDKNNLTKYTKEIAAGYANGLFWNDLGLIGLSFIIGPIATLLIIYLMLRTCWKCKARELLFIRATILVGVLGSIFTSQEIYRAGNFIFVALMMYTDFKYRLEHENRDINISQCV